MAQNRFSLIVSTMPNLSMTNDNFAKIDISWSDKVQIWTVHVFNYHFSKMIWVQEYKMFSSTYSNLICLTLTEILTNRQISEI